MLFRKKGTSSSVLALALLIAILASVSSVINHINSQVNELSAFTSIGEAYLILSKNSKSMVDSEVDKELASLVIDEADVEYVLLQKLFEATLVTKSGNYSVHVRGVEDVQAFFDVRKAHIEGTVAGVNETQANAGEILARLASVNAEDEVSLAVAHTFLNLKVVGIAKTLTQSDAELIVPMKIANQLAKKDEKVSFIEFALKHSGTENEVVSRVIEFLPANVKVIKVQRLRTFMQDINNQTLFFLGVWSSMVYAVVVAASYVVAIRLINEAKYDLATLRALGAKRSLAFKLVLSYTVTVTLFGSVLGLATGIVGAQVASTVVRRMWADVEVNPFLEAGQALQLLLSALAASILGCIYPAFKSTQKTYLEQPL